MKKMIAMLLAGVMATSTLSTTAFAFYDEQAAESTESAEIIEEITDDDSDTSGLTPEGNLTLVDDIGDDENKASQQFITLVTKAGNTFYLIIDRDSDGNQNVHFLNMVDEADLLALMDEEEAAKYQTEEVAGEDETPATATAEPEATSETEVVEETKEEKKSSAMPLVMLALFLIGTAGVGGFLYVRLKGGLPSFNKKAEKPDPDADYHDEDEDALQLPEDDGDEDEEVDVNEDYEAEADDEPV